MPFGLIQFAKYRTELPALHWTTFHETSEVQRDINQPKGDEETWTFKYSIAVPAN